MKNKVAMKAISTHIERLQETFRESRDSPRNRFEGGLQDLMTLPDYALSFINALALSIKPKKHLDPWITLSSPSMIFDFGESTGFCINGAQGEIAKHWRKGLNLTVGDGLHLLDALDGTFDLVTSLLPFSYRLRPDEKKLLGDQFSGINDKSTIIIAKSLALLKENGIGIFLVPDGFFFDGKAEELFAIDGFYIDAIFGLAHGALRGEMGSGTGIASNIIVIRKGAADKYFISELTNNEEDIQNVLDKYLAEEYQGLERVLPRGCFRGLAAIKLAQQIDKLETQYKSFTSHKLNDICEIKGCKAGEKFEELENTIYVKKTGSSQVIKSLQDTTSRHQSLLQLKFDPNVVNSVYMHSYFRSAIGRLMLQSAAHGSVVPSRSKAGLLEMPIPIPSMSEQKNIIVNIEKLDKLRKIINEFDNELALNPSVSFSVLEQLDNMIDVMGDLTGADKVRAMVREGESSKLEFKQTLSWNVRLNQKDIAMQIASLKQIVAFLNSSGGTLLIGVADDGSIPGINFEIEKLHKNSLDSFQTTFKNLLKDRIGEQFYPYFDVVIHNLDDVHVLLVNCRPSRKTCWLINPVTKKEEFYVRAPAATDKLEGRALMDYIDNHNWDA